MPDVDWRRKCSASPGSWPGDGMSLWAVVPVKPLDQAKSRLAGALAPKERASLVQALLERTVGILRQVPAIGEIIVVTGDPGVAAWASQAGNRVLREDREPDLNRELASATRLAQEQRVEAVLIVHADLPRVTVADIEAMAASAAAAPIVVIAPDRHGRGTNALLCAPPGLIEYRFGPDSFSQHCAQAQAAGASLDICTRPGLALDLDLPEDLELLHAGATGSTPTSPPGWCNGKAGSDNEGP
jgi:2-phospho-L-lactate guanylyltransferase